MDAAAKVARHFPGAEIATNFVRPQTDPLAVICPEGYVWPLRCRCPQHPHRGHDARPKRRQ